MAMTVDLRDERGGVLFTVGDEAHLLGRVLPPPASHSFELLQYVDRWGDTMFNRDQMEPFLRDWSQVERMANGAGERAFVLGVERLAQRCRKDIHLYVWFVGD